MLAENDGIAKSGDIKLELSKFMIIILIFYSNGNSKKPQENGGNDRFL
jgi:hypothetical protein